MGGRCAERLEYQDLSTGAADDLRRATQLARQMLTQWGMSERIGPVTIDNGAGNPYLGQTLGELSDISEHTQEVVDDELKALLVGVEHEVYELLEKNKEMLDQLVVQLVDHETLDEPEIKALLSAADKQHS
jgi:cell division protease FtsH